MVWFFVVTPYATYQVGVLRAALKPVYNLIKKIDILLVVLAIFIQVVHAAITVDVNEKVHSITVGVSAVRNVANFLIVKRRAVSADDTEGFNRVALCADCTDQPFQQLE